MNRDKIRRRARRAFEGKVVHRITMIDEKHLTYRINSTTIVTVKRDKLGRIYVPNG